MTNVADSTGEMKSWPRIVGALMVLLFAAEVVGWLFYGVPGTSFLVLLGTVLGPVMAFEFSGWSTTFDVMLSAGFIGSFLLVAAGFWKRRKVLGQGAVVLGVCLWAFCGMIGLGTGT